ncbi:MAG TPA: hypothetical protein VFS40_05495 [Gemmatimonadales bacterium]|nr:hypothetical protein [Gemmatimonadales bacterium]
MTADDRLDRDDRSPLDRVPPVPPSPLSERHVPGTGTRDPALTQLTPEEEPETAGTLFLTMIILTVIGAVWIVVYALLLHR